MALFAPRANTMDFRPPRPNPLVQFAFRLLMPILNKTLFGGLTVEVDAASLQKLKALQGQRCLLLPNHPTEWDPCVMFTVSHRLHENFFFVAAREVFDYSYGLRGWIFQRLGVYSLVRGSNDRGSFKTSLEILAQNRGRLVIFIEGEISSQNDTLLPLESGVVQLAFMAYNDVYKQLGKDFASLPSLYICPIGIKYRYHEKDPARRVEKSLTHLEKATATVSAPESPRLERIRNLASTVLTESAHQFGYALNAEKTLAQNVAGLTDFMLTKLEQVINLPQDTRLSPLDRIRRIRNLVDKVLGQGEQEAKGVYQQRLFRHQKAVLGNFYLDLERIVNFIAIYDGYLHPEMTHDRCVEMLRRLEREVFGAIHLAPPRKAMVSIREPIDLKNYFQDFQQDKRTTLGQLTQNIEQEIYQGLQEG